MLCNRFIHPTNMSYILVVQTFMKRFKIMRNIQPKSCTYKTYTKRRFPKKTTSNNPIHFTSLQHNQRQTISLSTHINKSIYSWGFVCCMCGLLTFHSFQYQYLGIICVSSKHFKAYLFGIAMSTQQVMRNIITVDAEIRDPHCSAFILDQVNLNLFSCNLRMLP
jgi:hypothetical protein